MKIINKMFRGFNSTSYEITEFVNFGGMSQIYRAISKDDSKLVIIKLLTFSKTESPQKVRQRLAIEGIVSSKLNHPGICKTLDYVYDDEGNYGLVLENLIGNNLSEIINRLRTPFSLKETLVVIFEICEALKYAHNSNNELKNKIFHRDLKPSNIFITDEMQVKLLDFGISCELDDKWQSIQLNSGFTKCYTPPDLWKDQSTFNHNSYTEAHDVYCLGLIFYELLTKKKAFKNLKQNQQGIIECISEHGFIDEDIISTFRKWTHLNPNERFQNIEELTNALREIKITHYDNSNIITIASFEDNDKTQQDYTEIDNTLFTNTVHNLTTIEEVVSLNILLSLQKKIHSSEIRNEIIETTKRIAKTINQTHLNYQKIDYTSFSIRALSITHGNLLKEIVPTLIFSQEQHFKDLLKSMKSIITENEAYNIYSQIYKTIQRTNHIDIDLFLNEIRLSFELDPFNCDSEKNCEGFQESLTALLFVKLNLKSLNEAKKFINDSIRIYKIPEESFYTNALFFYSSIKSKIAINTSEYEKQVISLTLSRIAFADKKIDISEKKFLESINSQLNLRSNNYHLLLNKDKKELFISLPQELQAFTLVTLFNFIMVKKVTDKKEDEVIEEIFTQFLDHALPLSMNSHYLFMDFILEKLHEIKKHPKILKMFGRIKLIGPIDFEKTLMTFNKIRSVCINNPPKSIKEILYFSELINENSSKNEQPITIDQDKLFYMHLYYLILRIGLFPKNKQEEQLITFLTSQKIDIDHLPRDFDAVLNWKIPYLILKLAIRFSMKDTDFKNKMKDFDFKRNLYALMYELRINDQNLNFAKRMIKCNYGDLDIFTE